MRSWEPFERANGVTCHQSRISPCNPLQKRLRVIGRLRILSDDGDRERGSLTIECVLERQVCGVRRHMQSSHRLTARFDQVIPRGLLAATDLMAPNLRVRLRFTWSQQ